MFKKLIKRFQVDFGLLVLRIGIGTMFMFHGYPKLMGGVESWESLGRAMSYLGINFLPILWGFLASIAEFFGGLCIALGLFFKIANTFLFITMSVAVIMHLSRGDGLNTASHAIEMGILFFCLVFIGPGRYRVMTSSFKTRL